MISRPTVLGHLAHWAAVHYSDTFVLMRCISRLGATFIVLAGTLLAQWRPTEPAELAIKSPAIDPKADAEVLYWEVRIDDNVSPPDIWVTYSHLLRTKIFTDKGAKDLATVEIPFRRSATVTDLAARTIKADGTIVEVAKDAIKESDLWKGKKRRGMKVKTLAFPAVEPGAIIEYRYRETRMKEVANYVHLEFSRDLPVHEVKYLIKPLQVDWLPYRMRVMDFNVQRSPFTMQPQGQTHYAVTSMKNVPAFKEEPNMPPADDVRPWMLIYYEEDKKLTPDKYWKEIGKDESKKFSQISKPEGAVKKLAGELTAAASSQEQKVSSIFQFCQSKIKNVFGSEVTAAQREQFKGNENSGDTLKRMMGTGYDINALFAALVNAVGFEARLAKVADRSRKFFAPQMMTPHFLPAYDIAVKYPSGWKFYDVAARHLPEGMLRWQEEGAMALVTDPKEPVMASTPMTAPDKSKVSRSAELEVQADGTIEGTFHLAYTGHLATERRTDMEDDTDEERRESVKQELAAHFEGAELSDLKVQNVKDPAQPLAFSGKIRIQGYAQRTGKRLFLQPAFFQKGVPPRFAASERKFDVSFDYPWSETDRVTLQLPEGMEMDQPTAPQSVKIGEAGEYNTTLSRSKDSKQLIYTREFSWGLKDQLLFPVQAYPVIKKAFDFVNEQDGHAITLKAAN
ncbi:MAG: DUF3857 domain-containing protein [Bryobacteraceae bacterium]